jgi:biopolymer transport protein ExbD
MNSRLRLKPKIMTEINIVPFTDVVLVLLVIFMVTTPFLFQGAFQVNLPKVAAPSPNIPEAITMTVTAAGKILLNGAEVSLDALGAALQAELKGKPGAPVMIEADRNVSHGMVMGVMSKAYEVGVSRLGIAVEQDSSSAPENPAE